MHFGLQAAFNPHPAEAIDLNDDELNQIAADMPLDDEGEEHTDGPNEVVE